MLLCLNQQTKNAYLSTVGQYFPSLLKRREPDSHKGSFGNLGIFGSCEGMSGAIVLTGSAALLSGSGRVWLGFAQGSLPVPFIAAHPELMLKTATDLAKRPELTVIAIGCGLGISDNSYALLNEILKNTKTAKILDADALNLLAMQKNELSQHPIAILTPHPLEAARLLNTDVLSIQNNRILAAQNLAKKYQAWVVLKGQKSIVANPKGWFYQNESGSPALATPGSGDVLTGMIASFVAQHLPIQEAVCAAVWLHGAAADVLSENGIGPIGLTANEIAPAARWLRNHLLHTLMP